MKDREIWVNMNDKAMSGWGQSKNGTNTFCVICETYEQAEAIVKAAEDRPEMKYVAISSRYRKGSGRTTIRHFGDLSGNWLKYMPKP